MRLSLAPISGRHDADSLTAFYREAAACPDIARVYVGELFCSRRLLPLDVFSDAVSLLEDAGKEPVFSTLALPARETDFADAAPYVARVGAVEVGNLGFLPWLRDEHPDKTAYAGPICNLYNRDDLEIVRDWGVAGVSTHIDLMPETIADLSASGILPVEVFLHGRPPLAFSWRCYSARFAGREQSACGMVCRSQGALVFRNLEDEDGFVADGPSVLPGQVVSTAEEARGYSEAGAVFGRLWVEPGEIAPVASAYAALLSGAASVEEAKAALESASAGRVRYGTVARRRLG